MRFTQNTLKKIEEVFSELEYSIRYEKGKFKLPKIPKVVFTTSAKTRSNKPSTGKSPSVDDILDKISRHGMQSLTAEERRTLDKASDEMKRRAR